MILLKNIYQEIGYGYANSTTVTEYGIRCPKDTNTPQPTNTIQRLMKTLQDGNALILDLRKHITDTDIPQTMLIASKDQQLGNFLLCHSHWIKLSQTRQRYQCPHVA